MQTSPGAGRDLVAMKGPQCFSFSQVGTTRINASKIIGNLLALSWTWEVAGHPDLTDQEEIKECNIQTESFTNFDV